MAVKVVVGSQWGDEAKAKVVDFLASWADIVVRFQGGANAGHTVIVDGQEFIFHLIPAGIMHPGKICVIGNGVVLDPVSLSNEILELKERGIDVEGRLLISQNTHLVMPYHKLLDELGETSKGSARIGTTGRGIGPAYRDKAARTGIRIVDLLDRDLFREKLQTNIRECNAILTRIYDHEPLDEGQMVEEYQEFDSFINPYVKDVSVFLNKAIEEGKNILFEGAQGALLDVDYGTYPYVTSSNTVASSACVGSGIGPTMIDEVIGVMKAYTTRVGNGPLPTELTGEFADKIRELGGEYGATTGRPRRCGWFDAVVGRLSVRLNGISSIALTKLDVLDTLPRINICTSYLHNGKVYENFPTRLKALEECEPQYDTLPGWQTSTSGIRSFNDLPPNARAYLYRISELVGAKINLISVGSDRAETIVV